MLSEPAGPSHAEHFESLEQQAHAAHLGMWVFLASEVLLFAGLFALYTVYRLQHPAGFALGLAHSEKTIGSINTAILLASSYAIATGVVLLRAGRRARTIMMLSMTIVLGLSFIALKLYEYSLHFAVGIRPGGQGTFFESVAGAESASFWTLYYVMTGLHIVHVTAGLLLIAWVTSQILRGVVTSSRAHPLSLVAMYWHLVDVVWIFLWPLFYLTGKG